MKLKTSNVTDGPATPGPQDSVEGGSNVSEAGTFHSFASKES